MMNYQKKPVLMHDGDEYDFIYKKNHINCPICRSDIFFSVYNSDDFDKLAHPLQDNLAKNVACLVKNENECGRRYTYKRLALRIDYTKCELGGHDFAVIFTFGEIQNTRYGSHLLGVFQVTKEQLDQ
ncbi:hypothetical protein ACR71G_09080 [Xenorhabdus bovienii]|uniref:hypothetical protein n=1 Tax=Xenorhabdus bovienii TaxID=40576 RepID=UPI0023B2B274|nr:hypothetical protein [Xenorhabdus bovienii]MDE9545335.1 hypothetical protein [Xenorhabdus bovienii]